MNEENLKPFNTIPPEELKQISIKAGKSSGKSRRAYKTFREEIKEVVTDKDRKKIIKAMIKEAIEGNVRAFEALRDTSEGKPSTPIALEPIGSKSLAEIEAEVEAAVYDFDQEDHAGKEQK